MTPSITPSYGSHADLLESSSASSLTVRTPEQRAVETPLLQITQIPFCRPRFANCLNMRACRETIHEVLQFRPGVGASLSGFGLMVDMYDLSAMNVALDLLEQTYGPQSPAQQAMMTSSVLIGSVVGQLGFGACSDKIGRKNLTLLVSGLTLIGSLGTALALPLSKSSPQSIYCTITAMRFLLGLGIGGEFPLSASNTVEQTQIKNSSTALAYAMMILNSGAALAGSVFTGLLKFNPGHDDVNWRLGLGFGAVLSAITLTLRFCLLKESPVFTQQAAVIDMRIDLEAHHEHTKMPHQQTPLLQQVKPITAAKKLSIVDKLQTGLKSPWLKPVAGAAITWFLYDVSAFGIGLYSSDMLADKGDNLGAAKSLLLSNAVALPFSALSMLLISDRLLGRQKSQILGLGGMAIMLGCMAISQGVLSSSKASSQDMPTHFTPKIQRLLFTTLFAAYNSFDAVGPGTSTFAFSSEIFPAHSRGTFHGIAAAAGKAGGALGAMGFPYMKKCLGTEGSILLTGGVCALGALLTHLLLPNYTNQHLQVLEELGNTASDDQLVKMIYDKNPPTNASLDGPSTSA